jgi:hypothetical protein
VHGARIDQSVTCGRCSFISSAARAKKAAAGIWLTCSSGVLVMSTAGSTATWTGRGSCPQRDSGVTA